MPKATIFDVADLAGVSIKTVSRVVNREANVRELTRERVEHAISQLNYKPRQSARNLASNRSHLIGLVYDDPDAYELPSAGYIVQLQQGALKACRAERCELLIHPCNYRKKNVVDDLMTLIEEARPAGLVLCAPLSNMPKIVNAIASTDTPLVRLAPGAKNGKLPTVSTNDKEFSAEMTRYLASLGHKRIAFVTGDPIHKAVAKRFLGYQQGLQQCGIEFDERLVASGDNSIGSGEAAAEKFLNYKQRPSAIFAANDDMAAGVLRVADRMGIKVPGELSIAGCDDISLARQVYPALTTIRQPLSKMAEVAAMSLINRSRENGTTMLAEVLPAELKTRDSTGPAPRAKTASE